MLAPQRGLTAIAKSKPKTEKTTNGRLPELSNFESPPAEPGVYHDAHSALRADFWNIHPFFRGRLVVRWRHTCRV